MRKQEIEKVFSAIREEASNLINEDQEKSIKIFLDALEGQITKNLLKEYETIGGISRYDIKTHAKEDFGTELSENEVELLFKRIDENWNSDYSENYNISYKIQEWHDKTWRERLQKKLERCQICIINGIPCHETGCSHAKHKCKSYCEECS